MDTIKTRFAPSPTGYLHVGGARTALFNFAMARKSGGTFLLRIEDTDRARHEESAVAKIVDDLRWLGIEWDEGIDVGGPAAPYRQSERLEIYRDYAQKLIDAGKAYYAFDTAEELEAMRKTAEAAKVNFSYPRPASFPTAAETAAARAAGKPVVIRLVCPGKDVTIHDEAFGDVTMPADQQDDFVILKDDGYPTYHLANVIDDALMGITYIMRGQEFLGQTWRHVLLRSALGFAEPRYCHLPLIMDMAGRKLSKRDGDVEVHSFRKAGYLPGTLVNFIALLGWNPGENIERFTLDELITLFDVSRMGKTNAKFDREKLLAFSTIDMAAASPERLLAGFKDFLSLNPEVPIPAADDDLLARVLEANKGMRTFGDIVTKSGVLFGGDDAFEYDPAAVAKVLQKGDNAGYAVLAQVRPELAKIDWTADGIHKWLEDFCQRTGQGMGKVAQPLRVAVTGSTISPQIVDTLLFLGREKTLARIDRCLPKP
ncbi:MAG: glutamate--tRNA ligase [Planctomycetaceae bacterium]|nr:glutamate--tRNA ligase [Planctomycetaceae bacterium]